MSRVQVLCLVSGLLGAAGFALAAESVSNLLSVHHVVVGPGGVETSEAASTARPGDLLEYVADFHNGGASVARGLSATLPLPVGTEYVASSAHPAGARASVDGINFDSIPLKRIVKSEDGTAHEELVPAREYRYLRWVPTDLQPRGDLSVSARVRIAAAR